MKKGGIIWIFLAVLAGCEKHLPEVGPSNVPLVFQAPVVGKQTKTPVPGDIGSTYDAGESFRAWGWLSFSDIECSNFTLGSDGTTPNGQEYFANLKAFHDGSPYDNAEYWTLTPTKYWPKATDARLTIHALSPYDVDSDCSAIHHYWQWSDNDDKHVGFVVDGFSVKDNPAEQYDLLYSDFTFNAKRSDYSGDPYDEPSDPGFVYNGINIKFNHALSSVQISVKQDIDYEVYGSRIRLFLTGVTLKNAYKTGTFVENRKDNSYWGTGTKPDGFEQSANAQPNAYKILTDDKRGPKWINRGTEQDYELYSKGWLKKQNGSGEWETVEGDVPMITNGTWHVARNVQIKRGLEVVFRNASGWDQILGHIKGTLPYERGKEFPVSPTGSDISILDDGTYDIHLNPTLVDGLATAKITPPQPDSYYAGYDQTSSWTMMNTPGYKLLNVAHTLKEKDAWGNYFVGGENMLAIPQPLHHTDDGEGDVTLEIKYVVKYALVNIEKTVNVSLYNLGGITEWEPGKRYIYSFTFTMDKIILDPVVATDWTDVSVN